MSARIPAPLWSPASQGDVDSRKSGMTGDEEWTEAGSVGR